MQDLLLVVRAESLDQLICRAAVILDCSLDEVAYAPWPFGEPGGAAWLVASLGKPADGPGLAGRPAGPRSAALPDAYALRRMTTAQFVALLDSAASLDCALFPAPGAPPAPPLRVEGDVSPTAGRIASDGDVFIGGSVLRGGRVRAGGRGVVYGDVEAGASIVAGADVRVKRGLLGTVISLRGDVACLYAQGARIEARSGSIHVLESAVQSHLNAGRAIDVCESILGGSSYAAEFLRAGVVGSPRGLARTRLVAGPNRRLRALAEVARERRRGVCAEIAACDAAIGPVVAAESAGDAQPPERRRAAAEWAAERGYLRAAEQLYAAASARLLAAIDQPASLPLVRISDRAYPGCAVEIDDAGYEVAVETQFATLWKDYGSGIVTMTPFE